MWLISYAKIAERTEQPTPRKLQKARQKGRLPQSQELMSIATLLMFVLVLTLLGPSLMQWFITQIKQGMSCQNGVFADPKGFLDYISGKTVDLILVICPILAALFAGSVMAGVAISGV
ncbi:MAG: EscU/YscU/HrcU family type III secretion system export apparatus switch protein, partial [Planctomycetota bacterium]